MPLSSRVAIAVLAAACAVTPAAAQWLDVPTPGMPRTADGKPNLTAPAPRTADGKPDLSGLWSIDGLGFATNITTTEMLPWAQKVYKARAETYGRDDPGVRCLPDGPRAALSGLDPFRLIQTPTMVVILHEPGTTRQIFTDGRALPKDPQPTWMGYSIGRWDGDTFVVESAGFNDKTWLDFQGHPHTDALRVTERYRRTDYGHMQLAITFDDPKTYTKPFSINVAVNFLPDTDLIESVCLENEKDQQRLVGHVNDERKAGKKVSREVLARYVGTYEVEMLGTWTVSVNGDELQIELGNGGGKQTVFAVSDTLFSFPSTGGTVKFITDGKNPAKELVLTIVEGDIKGTRAK
ncbi:MAG TPA: DUF3471 domain-containing protein [Vicinamibacterales bacterium]|jgi:hypothetical protein